MRVGQTGLVGHSPRKGDMFRGGGTGWASVLEVVSLRAQGGEGPGGSCINSGPIVDWEGEAQWNICERLI